MGTLMVPFLPVLHRMVPLTQPQLQVSIIQQGANRWLAESESEWVAFPCNNTCTGRFLLQVLSVGWEPTGIHTCTHSRLPQVGWEGWVTILIITITQEQQQQQDITHLPLR